MRRDQIQCNFVRDGIVSTDAARKAALVRDFGIESLSNMQVLV
jgi:hypothetical protein